MSTEKIDRRLFLKTLGLTATGVALAGCGKASDNGNARSAENGEMTCRTSATGDRVSLLGFGCMRFPTIDNERGAAPDQEEVNKMVDYAIEHGVNYFDTAPVYHGGLSESTIGTALQRHPRDKFFVATKLSNMRGEKTLDAGKEMYLASMRNLKVDYIDYYLLHSIGGSIEDFNARFIDNGLLDFLLEERRAGRIRNLGWSFHGKQECFDYVLAMHEAVHWDFVQIQLNYKDWSHAGANNVNASYLYGELAARGIPVVVMEPLLGGRLANLPGNISHKMLERSPSASVASWAFRYAGSRPEILTVLSGMTYMEHLQDNLHTYSPLQCCSDEEYAFLEQMTELMIQYPLIECTACNYCLPCPYGVDIPAIFTHYNKCVNHGLLPQSSDESGYRKLRRAFLVGYDRAVPSIRQADHCINCAECVKKCPQHIAIPRELRRINDYAETLKQGKEF